MDLVEYINALQINGQYWFLHNTAQNTLGCSETALRRAVDRLVTKRRLVKLRDDFILIIPIEYKNWGIIPADWFIDSFMRYVNKPYYVGLLSAASLYGAAHQKPQIFQVVTEYKYRSLKRQRVGVVFYVNNEIKNTPTRKMQVHTGYIVVSTPEVTGLDIVKYYRACGYLSNVATVLSELHESMQEELLLDLVQNKIYTWPIIQRFGYLMDQEQVGGSDLTHGISRLIAKHKPKFTPLLSVEKHDQNKKDHKWRLYINEDIEIDT